MPIRTTDVSASLRAVGRRAALTASAESVTPSNTSAQEPCVTIEEVMSTSVAVVRPPTAMPTRATLPTGWSAQAASGGLAVVTSLRSAVALDLLRSRATYSRDPPWLHPGREAWANTVDLMALRRRIETKVQSGRVRGTASDNPPPGRGLSVGTCRQEWLRHVRNLRA
jgi:hypothetical protein